MVMEFTKLKEEEKLAGGFFRYGIPFQGKLQFGSSGIVIRDFPPECIKSIFSFSYKQASNLNQKEGWDMANESEKRTPYEMFLDTFNGKAGEEASVRYFNDYLNIKTSGVDYSITGKNEGDSQDIEAIIEGKPRAVSVRTTYYYSNLLLLETSKSFSVYDAFLLARIRYSKDGGRYGALSRMVPHELRTNDFCKKHAKELYAYVSKLDIEVEITGKLFKGDYDELNKTGHVIRRNDYLGKTKILTDNRYVCSGDLRKPKSDNKNDRTKRQQKH